MPSGTSEVPTIPIETKQTTALIWMKIQIHFITNLFLSNDSANAGVKRPRPAVRLNDLLALPAGLQRTSVLTFGLWTEEA